MIPIADPKVSETAKERVEAVLDSGRMAGGPEVAAFENEFSDFCGADAGVATTNGTTALHAALHACRIGPGDRVVTTPFSFIASANAVRLVGADPVFADIDPRTYNLDPEAVERAVTSTPDVAAILAVHLYGLPADMSRLRRIADDHDCLLIEDAAQAHGGAVHGDRVGSLGDVACFSFYPTKNMTTGEGGMVVTDDSDIEIRTRRFINHGREDSNAHVAVGHNFRLPAVAGAIGRDQLDRLPANNDQRRENAERLTQGLSDTAVRIPTEPDGRRHVFHQYTVRSSDRDALAAHLEADGIESKVYYPRPIHHQPAYDDIDATCPEAERAAEEVLSVPVHPGVSGEDLDRIVESIREFT